jgi:hypothetical protein
VQLSHDCLLTYLHSYGPLHALTWLETTGQPPTNYHPPSAPLTCILPPPHPYLHTLPPLYVPPIPPLSPLHIPLWALLHIPHLHIPTHLHAHLLTCPPMALLHLSTYPPISTYTSLLPTPMLTPRSHPTTALGFLHVETPPSHTLLWPTNTLALPRTPLALHFHTRAHVQGRKALSARA